MLPLAAKVASFIRLALWQVEALDSGCLGRQFLGELNLACLISLVSLFTQRTPSRLGCDLRADGIRLAFHANFRRSRISSSDMSRDDLRELQDWHIQRTLPGT